jgi:hypothetical protein
MKRVLLALVPFVLTLSLLGCGTTDEGNETADFTDNGQPDLFVP